MICDLLYVIQPVEKCTASIQSQHLQFSRFFSNLMGKYLIFANIRKLGTTQSLIKYIFQSYFQTQSVNPRDALLLNFFLKSFAYSASTRCFTEPQLIFVRSQQAKSMAWFLDVLSRGEIALNSLHKMQIGPELLSLAVHNV